MNITAPPRTLRGGGFDQFVATTTPSGLGCHIASDLPYSLDHTCSTDVICLLLGNITATVCSDDGRPRPVVFHGETVAYHPPGTRLRIEATDVRHGFIAFSYADGFLDSIEDSGLRHPRRAGNRENLRPEGACHLAQYARRRLMNGIRLDRNEIGSLATLAYLEVARHLALSRQERGYRLSEEEFRRVGEYVSENIGATISCADVAAAVQLPVRVVFNGIKERTGHSLYRFITERRVEAAVGMLERSGLPLGDVANLCGFSSQQHMTSVFAQRVGATPLAVRLARVREPSGDSAPQARAFAHRDRTALERQPGLPGIGQT